MYTTSFPSPPEAEEIGIFVPIAIKCRASLASAVVLALVLVGVVPAATDAASTVSLDPHIFSYRGPSVPVIVQSDGANEPVARAVRRAGGVITRALPIVNGFAARVPSEALDEITRVAGIRAVTLDRAVRMLGSGSDQTRSPYRKIIRAHEVQSAGVTGSGVTVALVDTGVADVGDLSDRIVTVTDDVTGERAPCVNFSGEATCADSYGHGTFMAGMIAGSGKASGGTWTGVAPGARILSVKVAGRSGATDVSTVLAAIQWVVSFKDRYGIRALNLSLGTDGTQSYRTDPFNYAVERAWHAGVVVVVAASNRGPDGKTISKPGDDPWVITVAATDDKGTIGLRDDAVPNFSARGPTAADGIAKPDVVAPGAHIVSLRAPGSAIDAAFPTTVDDAYRRGSGTSMSAAAVSGAAALVLSANPTWSPDQVKYALTSTARPVASTDRMAVGAGVIDVAAAVSAPQGTANAGLDRSTGMGSLDASRGSVRVEATDPLSTLVSGAQTLQLLLWDPVGYTTGDWSALTWYGAQWHGAQWHGAQWHGAQWHGAQWHGAQWHGTDQADESYGTPLPGGAWLGAWE